MKKLIKILFLLTLVTTLGGCRLFGFFPKCKISACRTRMVHSHPRHGKFFRGMPICKKQNPLTGDLFKRPKEQLAAKR